MMTPDEILALIAAHGSGLQFALAPFHPANTMLTDTLRSLVDHAQKLTDQVRRATLYLDTRNPQTARAVLAE